MSISAVPNLGDDLTSLSLAPQISSSDIKQTEGNSASTVDEAQLSADLELFLSNPSLRSALADGSLDLASYSGQVEEELEVLESKCVAAYREKADDVQGLQTDLHQCQTVLNQLHEMLLGFQADLGGLSTEIRQLQERSRSLDTQLVNRKGAEEGLRVFLEKIIISPAVANTIATGRVNPSFLHACQELNEIYRHTHAKQPQAWAANKIPGEATVAGQDMKSHVKQLRLLAAGRVRDYFLQQMALLRRPQTNVRMIQVHGLLKYADLYDFLQEASPTIATEILNVYAESMSKTLQQLFRTYAAQLLLLDATKHSASRHDVIAVEDALLRDTLTTRAKKRTDVFTLGNRAAECLDDANARPILAHVATQEKKSYPYERLFRSLLGHLLDAVTNEHVFCRQYFKRDVFNMLFGAGTLSVILEQLENYLFTCHDALCLLLVIKVTHAYKRNARQRHIHSLDPFFDQVTKLVWPRLKMVMEGHLRSLKQATPMKLGGVELHAHYVTRRFAEFICSILLILQDRSQAIAANTTGNTAPRAPVSHSPRTPKTTRSSIIPASPALTAASGDHSMSAGEKLLEDLSELSDEYAVLLDRLSDAHNSQKKRIVFKINNLDQVVSIFQERRVIGKEFNRFVDLLMKQREDFVEEELLSVDVETMSGFSKMIAFVQQSEAELIAAPKGSYQVNIQEVESLVLDFASHWKSRIEVINRNVLSYFSNFRNGMEILKQVLTQLLLYYTRFQDVIRKVWKKQLPPFCREFVGTSVILAEIKKYALAI